MAKLTRTELRDELSKRLYNIIPDTTLLDKAIKRSVRTIDGLASYIFLQKKFSIFIIERDEFSVPNDMNIQKENALYIESIKLEQVPFSELRSRRNVLGNVPSAYALRDNEFVLSNTFTGEINLYYQKIMNDPTVGETNYAEIPESWYDIILDVAEYQQKVLYGVSLSEIIKQDLIERLKFFCREYNASLTSVININDEIIRKGG